MAAQGALDFRGIDVEPAVDDHLLLAVDDVEIALLIRHREVPGVHPPVRMVSAVASGLFQ